LTQLIRANVRLHAPLVQHELRAVVVLR